MAPIPRPDIKDLHSTNECPNQYPPVSGEDVVISGISGKFPESENVLTFMKNLYNKVDMVSGDDRRWSVDHPEIPNWIGKLNCIDKFDAQFFGVHYRQAWLMDPMMCMLLENVYGAVIDAGLNPKHLRDTKTSVFIGVSTSDSERVWYCNKTQISGLGLTGFSLNMLSNRISYWLGVTGPSCTVNSACSSSMQALQQAYDAITNGVCDAAIVGGVNLCLCPYVSLQYSRLGCLSEDGKTRCFDKNANGYARSEAITVMLLQKAKDSKRAYAQVVYAKSNCEGYSDLKVQGPEMPIDKAFFESFYREAKVLPSDVEYIEAFGAGLPNIDKYELKMIDEVFCKARERPILVGSVKSNMGHSEAASGVAAITKLCLAYQRGELAPNLHCDEPRDDVEGLLEGRIRIVTEPTPFRRGYTAASSFAFTGANVHVLLKGFAKKMDDNMKPDNLPRLVTASGRSESSLLNISEELENRPLDLEQIRLIHNIHEVPVQGHVFRCYNVLKKQENSTVSLAKEVEYYPGNKRPVWFVYSGMGSQWVGMGTQLMRIPIFAAAIENCYRVLAPKGIDLIRILTDPNPTMYDNILHAFVGIAAVQIGLTDILTALGIQPDNIIGHSVGELGCAYADGCLTAEEMILSAYSRGLVSVQTPFIHGSMAAVGLGYDEIKLICPLEIEVACHNGPDSCTISGPSESMKTFVGYLTAKGIFAKEVPCSNIAYHSKYIAEAGPTLLKCLQEVIKEPKLRSSRWVSTSVPQLQWEQPNAKFSSAEYHTNNLLKPVLFDETSRLIPRNAITIEIAPHGLLQAILRRSLYKDCINVSLTKRGHVDNVEYLLIAIGKLFVAGLDPKVAKLYPEVNFPVSTGTPLLSHLVDWEHSEEWNDFSFQPIKQKKSGERQFIMSTWDKEYQFMKGNVINELNIFPSSGYLVLVWETLGMMLGVHYTTLSVVFENICFDSDMLILDDSTLEFNIMIQKATGNFEIITNGGVVVSGNIRPEKSSQLEYRPLELELDLDEEVTILRTNDIYKMLFLKGYSYRDAFRAIESVEINFNKGKITFNNNWVTFIESIIQLNVLKREYNGISKPKLIQKLSINVKRHEEIVTDHEHKVSSLDATLYDIYDCTRCGGVELVGLVTTDSPALNPEEPVMQKYQFVPYFGVHVVNTEEAMEVIVQLIAQNTTSDNLEVVELVDEANKDSTILKDIQHTIERDPRKTCSIKLIPELNKHLDVQSLKVNKEINDAHLVVLSNLLNRRKIMQNLYAGLNEQSLIVSREQLTPKANWYCERFHLLSVVQTHRESFVLLKKRVIESENIKYITIKSNMKFAWVDLVQSELRTCDKLVLVSECDPMGGLLGLFNCLRREPGGHVLSLLLISDYSAPAFRPDLAVYQEQLNKNMALNVFKNNNWGSYLYLSIEPATEQSEHVYLGSSKPEISSLIWLEGPLTLGLKTTDPRKKYVKVYFSALTLQDVRKSSSRMHSQVKGAVLRSNKYGMDFCGRTSTGERVMGLLPTGAVSSIVEADVDMLWPVPAHWSMEDAVTVPQAYANAFYCLVIQSELVPGASVLIHSGTGALGQAAINICLAHDCDVYTTVSSLQKKEWLLKMFPRLKECNIGNSRSTDFEDIVMSGTKGIGCNIVINTLSGNLREVSQRCVSPMGVIVNVNEEDVMQNAAVGMLFFRLSRTFLTASMTNIFRASDADRRKKIQQLVANGIAKGYVKPLSRITFDMNETIRAFRFMSTGRHVGKVVLKIRDEELRPLVTQSRALFAAQPYFTCSDEGSYIVISGCDESGLELAGWLVQRGAKNLILHSQTSNASGYQAARIRSWRREGVKVYHSSESLQTETGCLQLLTDASKQGPVLGIFVAPRSARSGLFYNAVPDHFARDFSEKALVVMNLDSATRSLCPQLREFLVFSSVAAGYGSPHYSISGLTESVVERICEERCKLGLPGVALQWGDLNEFANSTGMVDTCGTDIDESTLRSFNGAIFSLDQLLKSKYPVVASYYCKHTNKPRKDLIKAVEEVTGIQDIKDMPTNYTLEQLSTGTMAAKEIQILFEREFHLLLSPQRILKMDLAELKTIQSQINKPKLKKKLEGLEAFFTYIDPEEFNAGDPLVRMPTVLSDGTEREEILFPKDTYLVLIPGMEGHKNIFLTITKRLKMNAFACQLELDNFTDSVQEMAAKMCKVIMKKLRPDSEFYLFAYSFGVTVALEIASLMESHGLTGKIFCLDGSPDYFDALLESHLGHLSERQLQDEVIKHMFHMMTGSSSESMERSLAIAEHWDEKQEVCMRHLRSRVNFSIQYQRSLIAMAYARILQARAYNDAHLNPLNSEIILLKATHNSLNSPVDNDYGLSKYSKQPVKIFELDCDHASAPFDLNCTSIVNEEIVNMDVFRKTNLCKSYNFNMMK